MVLYCIKFIFNQELTGFLITSTVLSAVIGLALQGTMSNIFSGLSLQLEAPFNLDDWVVIGGHEGKIVSQNWRTVTLLTRENYKISITNRFVSEDMIINYSRPTRRQIYNFYITLDYMHPPNLIKKLLREILD
jgi:small-conductance mechanosensitive channel